MLVEAGRGQVIVLAVIMLLLPAPVCHGTGFGILGPSLILASCGTCCMARFEQFS
jgi:hypothetical protein